MNYKEINSYPIEDYLKELGITPAKEHAYYGMYHSPFREDKTPSFKVDYDKKPMDRLRNWREWKS